MRPVTGAVRLHILCWLVLGLCPALARGESVLLTIEGKVEVARAGTVAWAGGTTNQALGVGDRVRTGIRSRATLRHSDLSVLRLDELTTVQSQAPAKPGGKPLLDQRSGASYFLNRERPADVEFRTPQASGAIRGTEFNLAVT